MNYCTANPYFDREMLPWFRKQGFHYLSAIAIPPIEYPLPLYSLSKEILPEMKQDRYERKIEKYEPEWAW